MDMSRMILPGLMILQAGLVDEEQVEAQPHAEDGIQPDEEDGVQPGLIDEEDDVFTGPDVERLAEDVAQFVQRLGPMEHHERLTLMKASLGIPPEPERYKSFDAFDESTRDLRHVGDLRWHGYYRMDTLSETFLPPMRYTQCDDPLGRQQCFHKPSPILQIFNMKLQTCMVDESTRPVEIYGIFAVRDDRDNFRNYLFNRSRENPLDISLTDGNIRLLSPKRGMSMKFNCLIEADIRVKAIGDDKDDKTLVDGCMEWMEGIVSFDTLYRCTSSGPYGSLVYDLIMFRDGIEATIQLDFVEVPEGGFDIQMCGYTTIGKHYYPFVDKNCEYDSFISSTGRLPQYFVAAMEMGDCFLVDFTEGKPPLMFKSTLHGTEEKDYYFHNGALVSVKVYWSTIFP